MKKYPDSSQYLVNTNDEGKPENTERIGALISYAEKEVKYSLEYEHIKFFPAKGSADPIWPEFSLIDTQTALDGKNKVIDDAFKKIDSVIEEKHKPQIETIKTDARLEYEKVTKRISKYARENYLPQLQSFSAQPSVSLSVSRDLLMSRIGQTGDSHFSQQGDGTKRRMMVSILQVSSDVILELDSKVPAEARSSSAYTPLKIWAFDEPEMHLHPGAQRDLYKSFENFKQNGFQIICSTHSTVFVNSSIIQATHLIELNGKHESCVVNKEEGLNDIIKQNLGVRNSDVFFSNVFVVLEGDTEAEAFPYFYENHFGHHFAHDNISLVGKGGWTQSKKRFKLLHEYFGNVVCLFDNDVAAKVGIKEADMPDSIKYIGTATIEDSFNDKVWLQILQSDYDLKDLNDGSSIWSTEKLEELRKEIDINNRIKKFPESLKRYYESKYREFKDGDYDYPAFFDKKVLGVSLAKESIKQALIPAPINDFLKKIQAKL